MRGEIKKNNRIKQSKIIMEKKKKTVAKTNKQRDEKNQVNCDGKHCCKKKKK